SAQDMSRTVNAMSVDFFVQAEDGIRDDLVTGVQTCALPICHMDVLADLLNHELSAKQPPDAVIVLGPTARYIDKPRESELTSNRSEERRVGKECRYRW